MWINQIHFNCYKTQFCNCFLQMILQVVNVSTMFLQYVIHETLEAPLSVTTCSMYPR